MKVILTERVPTLGNVGEIVNVSSGYGRNFLIPNRFAVLADASSKRQLDDQQRRLATKVKAQKDEALALKKKVDAVKIDLVKRVGANGKLFGSITNSDLSVELEARDIVVERRLIAMTSPIKSLGTFEVRVKLFQEVEAKFVVKVAMDPKQLEEIKAREAQAIKNKKKSSAKDIDQDIADEEMKASELATEDKTDEEIKNFENN